MDRRTYKLLKHIKKNIDVTSLTAKQHFGYDCSCRLEYLVSREYIKCETKKIREGDYLISTGQNKYSILPHGEDFIQQSAKHSLDKWFTRGIALVALIISILALLKQ